MEGCRKRVSNPNPKELEMGRVRVSYTSLRDIMGHNSASWNEIPVIKNPLLKHAALAYLQPMSTPSDVVPNPQNCFCGCGCDCFNAATLLHAILHFFGQTRTTYQHQHHQYDDDNDNGQEEVED